MPDDNDFAHFGMTTSSAVLPATYTVSFNVDPTNLRLIVEDDRVTFDLNGHTYQATSPIAAMLGTEAGRSGRLTVTDGTLSHPLQADLQIGTVAGGSGILNVTTGGLILGSPELFVGVNGAGTLNINGGGDVIADDTTLGLNAGSTGSATITGGGSSLLTASLLVGSSGNGVLNINAGGRVDSTTGVLGDLVGSTGNAHVDGVNSKWNLSSGLVIGRSGSGALNITGGGRVDSTTCVLGRELFSTGTVNVDGPGSEWINSSSLVVGDLGPGTLNITDGGRVQSAHSDVGIDNGSGEVTVNGAGSKWIVSDALNLGDEEPGTLDITAGGSVLVSDGLTIGRSGPAALNITGGGRIESSFGIVGRELSSTGTVNVDGSGSEWTNSGSLDIGDLGLGTLNITGGSKVQSAHSRVGLDDPGSGEVTVDGSGSEWIVSGELNLGVDGFGTLDITAGGSVVSNTNAFIGSGPFSIGTATVAGAGSTWTIHGNLHVGNGGINNGGVGTLRIQPGGTVAVDGSTKLHQGDSVVLEGGTLSTTQFVFLQGQGTFQWTSGTLHVGTFEGSLVNPSDGTLAPGQSAGTTTIIGNYTQLDGATLEIEIGGLVLGTQYDFVSVTGAAFMDGELDLTLTGGFIPNSSQTFVIANANNLLGDFDNADNGQRLTTSDGLGSFLVNYGAGSLFNPNQVVLSAFQPAGTFSADFDHDGNVDGDDLAQWRGDFGQNGFSDANGDGDSDGADFLAWQQQFGRGPSVVRANAPVPEPATTVVLFMGLLVIYCRLRMSVS